MWKVTLTGSDQEVILNWFCTGYRDAVNHLVELRRDSKRKNLGHTVRMVEVK